MLDDVIILVITEKSLDWRTAVESSQSHGSSCGCGHVLEPLSFPGVSYVLFQVSGTVLVGVSCYR